MSFRKRPRPVGETGTFLEDWDAQGVLIYAIACGVVLASSFFRDFPFAPSVRRVTRSRPLRASSMILLPRVWGQVVPAHRRASSRRSLPRGGGDNPYGQTPFCASRLARIANPQAACLNPWHVPLVLALPRLGGRYVTLYGSDASRVLRVSRA